MSTPNTIEAPAWTLAPLQPSPAGAGEAGAEAAAEEPTPCGWWESSHELRRGLAVLELTAWPAGGALQ